LLPAPRAEIEVSAVTTGHAQLDEAVSHLVDAILSRIDATQRQEDVILAAVRRLSDTAVRDLHFAVGRAYAEVHEVLDPRQREILRELFGQQQP
jgi:hypothetical protein